MVQSSQSSLGAFEKLLTFEQKPASASRTVAPPPMEQHATVPHQICAGAIVPGEVQMGYPDGMDHLGVLRDKIGRLRVEIAEIQALNQQFRRDGGKGADAQVAHGQRNERLQAIQHELVKLADLGRRVVSTEQMKEHRSRLHPAKQKQAA